MREDMMSLLTNNIDSRAATIEKYLIALKGYIVSFRIEAEFNTRFSYGDDAFNTTLFSEHGISGKHSKLKVDHHNGDNDIAYMEYTNAGYILSEIKENEQEILWEKVRNNPNDKELRKRYIHFTSESMYIDKMRIDRKVIVHSHDTVDLNIYRRQISAAVNYLSYLKGVIFDYWKKIPGYFTENDWKEERLELLIAEADEL